MLFKTLLAIMSTVVAAKAINEASRGEKENSVAVGCEWFGYAPLFNSLDEQELLKDSTTPNSPISVHIVAPSRPSLDALILPALGATTAPSTARRAKAAAFIKATNGAIFPAAALIGQRASLDSSGLEFVVRLGNRRRQGHERQDEKGENSSDHFVERFES
ncbi:hypothetical protein CDD81_5697 [Ophiocordyceps australis]|uniref:Uncharacterized protein n=1 Tax=Ophiocordyceps australis TaxID=1399860 RepID=A0A2C5Y284_9HYPO|nr:hypothetical protein CDD81_5697 [Ophiocordyceps australis]